MNTINFLDVVEIGADIEGDFYLCPIGENKGDVSKTKKAGWLGIKVTRTDLLYPDYLYYNMQYMKSKGMYSQVNRISRSTFVGVVFKQE